MFIEDESTHNLNLSPVGTKCRIQIKKIEEMNTEQGLTIYDFRIRER
ncbi:hypothetical protein BMS3Bbin03_02182 [bacterium BMS3Bbin03]|nr:hypothetical protein BMS3Bbin03_02182 [bacterium BMS3Bbin03]